MSTDVPNYAALDGRAPNTGARHWIRKRLENLPGSYAPQMQQAANEAKAGLAGYGGYKFGTDDPGTAENEGLRLDYTPGKMGAIERQGVQQVANQENASGTLHSSFARANIGSALQRMDEEKRGVATQYAAKINSILSRQSAEHSDLVGELTQLYGADAAYLAVNPLVTKGPPPPTTTPQGSTQTTFWQGKSAPNMATIKKRHPNVAIKPVQNADGSWKVVSA